MQSAAASLRERGRALASRTRTAVLLSMKAATSPPSSVSTVSAGPYEVAAVQPHVMVDQQGDGGFVGVATLGTDVQEGSQFRGGVSHGGWSVPAGC
jgi:hypothetical protein